LLGLIYWYGIYPLHGLIFARLLDAIARQAEARQDRYATVKDVRA